jgi:hypothetical protein
VHFVGLKNVWSKTKGYTIINGIKNELMEWQKPTKNKYPSEFVTLTILYCGSVLLLILYKICFCGYYLKISNNMH